MSIFSSIAKFISGGGVGGPSEGRDRRESEARVTMQSRPTAQRTGFDAMKNDVMMDFGMTPRDTEYYSRTAERRERALAGAEKMVADAVKDQGKSERMAAATGSGGGASMMGSGSVGGAPSYAGVGAAADAAFGDGDGVEVTAGEGGRKSTILTKPGGLLGSGEDEETRRRRSLIGS
tara:strand:+ start:159 stop:689 length:531 start_codon:yes stop_codon:yes gene_type:complete